MLQIALGNPHQSEYLIQAVVNRVKRNINTRSPAPEWLPVIP